MHLKIQLLSRSLKLSNLKPGCRVSAFHFFYEIYTTNGFLTSSSVFSALIPGSTPASLLKSKPGFDIVTQLADTGKGPSLHVYPMTLCQSYIDIWHIKWKNKKTTEVRWGVEVGSSHTVCWHQWIEGKTLKPKMQAKNRTRSFLYVDSKKTHWIKIIQE